MEIKAQRRFQRGKRHFIGSQCTLERVLLQLRNKRTFTHDNPRLRAAKQFVAGETHKTDARRNHLLRHGLFWQTVLAQIDQRTATEVGHHRHTQLTAQLRQLRLFNGFGESGYLIITGVDLHQQPGIFIHCRAIIFCMRAVGGAHFMQGTARLAHNIRNAKRTANLDQLATGNHHLFTAGGRCQH